MGAKIRAKEKGVKMLAQRPTKQEAGMKNHNGSLFRNNLKHGRIRN